MVCALLPLMVALVAFVLPGERVSRRQLLGFAIAIVGIALLGLGRAQTVRPNALLGNSLEMGAMLCAATYSVWYSEALQPLRRDDLTAFTGLRRHALLRALCLQCALACELGLAGHGVILFLGAFVTRCLPALQLVGDPGEGDPGGCLCEPHTGLYPAARLSAAGGDAHCPCNGWPVPPCWPASG